MLKLQTPHCCVVLISSRKRVDIPIYSFEQHQRQKETLEIYSPHVIILEGILALNDPRILEMLDMKVFVEADGDLCLSRRSQYFRSAKENSADVGASKSSVTFVREVER